MKLDIEPPVETSSQQHKKVATARKHKSRSATVAASLKTRLARLGLHSDADLILHFPLRYEDHTFILEIAKTVLGTQVQIQGRIITAEIKYRPRRQLICQLQDNSGTITLRFINFYPNQQKQLQIGALIRAVGEVREGFFGREMIHPSCEALDEVRPAPLPECLTPIYPTTAGLAQKALQKIIRRALQHTWPDTLPEIMRQRLNLLPFNEAIHHLHQPMPDSDAAALIDRNHAAWIRIKFDELLAQQISLQQARIARYGHVAPAFNQGGSFETHLLATLPFQLTAAQQHVWQEIAQDLTQPHPMSRLLQGDVGCGKTVIAALAAARAVDAGYQVAMMAPTEILAEQHYRKLSSWFAPLGLSLCWLTGAQTSAEKRQILTAIKQGEAQLIIGTHALIEESVDFCNLGLAVIDEQHRFGVAQRLALRKKSSSGLQRPHQLMMSATPIPRTLAMTYYADLDISVINQLPPGRKPVQTKLIAQQRRPEVIARVHAVVQSGQQAYWVCPLIEESEALQLQTAVDTHIELTAALDDLKVALIHGRLSAAEKAQIMEAFIEGTIQVLVATTVIEVGVDVPNASLMVIENAERFGLAQLHQLRGRIGRGTAASTCVLLYQKPLSSMARARLRSMHETQDGFEIARRDLTIRGPGEFLGARQSGQALLRYANLQYDTALIELAHQTAKEMLKYYLDACNQHLQRWLPGREEFLKT